MSKRITLFAILLIAGALGISGCANSDTVATVTARAVGTSTAQTTLTAVAMSTATRTLTHTPIPSDTPTPSITPTPSDTPTPTLTNTPFVAADLLKGNASATPAEPAVTTAPATTVSAPAVTTQAVTTPTLESAAATAVVVIAPTEEAHTDATTAPTEEAHIDATASPTEESHGEVTKEAASVEATVGPETDSAPAAAADPAAGIIVFVLIGLFALLAMVIGGIILFVINQATTQRD